jgi:hypothetical protein
MRKISIVISITLLCAFAVVRRRENQEAEPLFEEAITRVVEENQVVYQLQSDRETIQNAGDDLLTDVPTKASQLLSTGMDHIVWVTNGSNMTWLPVSPKHSIEASDALPLFWDLN